MNPGPGLRWLDALGPQKIRPGLARTRALLAALGNPQASFRTLLVGGTNGKGSAASAAASILEAAGLRVGLTTSPHLVRVTERVRLCGRDVSEAQLDSALRLVAAVSGEDALRPTYFEALVVAACELFRRARVSVGVVEVGIGGRLDATNVLDPEVSVVTNVEEDHLETLGPSLADVAREKAGIFRRGQPALTAATGEGLGVLRTEAGRAGARLLEISPSPAWDDVSPLPGAHQRANLALAVAAARAFAPLDDVTVRRGIAAIRWPGRLQTVRRPGLRTLLVDGAHNPAGAAALAAHLDAAGLSGRIDLVFGVLGDKAFGEMFAPLASRARHVVLVAPASPRAIPADALATRLGRTDLLRATSLADAISGLEGSGGDAPILVAGSLVLAGEALALVEPREP
ncbi:MAG: bifunctional folylpolyglutamate synthase/dihydrofolate synthase [Holophagales bacterium]|nr:bifunctional folylpolyglutamate synthase/dihydrofolate synthase [Holophagales bacterium]